MKKLLSAIAITLCLCTGLDASDRVPFDIGGWPHITVDQDPQGMNSLLEVHNTGDASVNVTLFYSNENGSGARNILRTMAAHSTWTVNSHDMNLPYVNGSFKGSVEYVVTGGYLVLTGDETDISIRDNFSHLNQLIPKNGTCVPTCTRFQTRFIQGGGFNGGTVFEINRGFSPSDDTFDVTMYDEPGNLLDQRSIRGKPQSFELPMAEFAPSNPFGSIYFNFKTSAAVATVFRANGKYSVMGEAWCLSTCDPCNYYGGCYNANNPHCPVNHCGNGVIDPGETCTTCPADVGQCPPPPHCGNGIPEPALGEDCHTCPQDVGQCPVCVPPNITLTGTPICLVGTPYNSTATATGTGLGPLTNSTLPSGLSRITNTVSGTPTQAKEWSWAVTGQCGTKTVPVSCTAPPTCAQLYPRAYTPADFTVIQGNDNLEGTVTIRSAWNPGDFHIYATSTLAKCNASQADYDKTHDSYVQACGDHSHQLHVSYHWNGHPSEYWWLTLKDGSGVVHRTGCIVNTHNRSFPGMTWEQYNAMDALSDTVDAAEKAAGN